MFYYLIIYPIEFFFRVLRKTIGHRRFKRRLYCGQTILSQKKTNEYIGSLIDSNKPFLVCRFGDAELKTVIQDLEIKFKLRNDFDDNLKKVMHLNAGFFPPSSENLSTFANIMRESITKVDMFGVWFNFMENYVIKKYSSNYKLAYLENLEPYRHDQPWSSKLEGKKVLVIHPFAESIRKQFALRDKLFENKHVLPKFNLITYKSVQTNAGATTTFKDWFEALNHMFDEVSKLDFDIAIVGCGSYGLPLSAKIRDLGKGVIHLAGATQILFGIRGSRWDSRKDMLHLFNDYWTRPSINEKPKDASKVEGGCYW